MAAKGIHPRFTRLECASGREIRRIAICSAYLNVHILFLGNPKRAKRCAFVGSAFMNSAFAEGLWHTHAYARSRTRACAHAQREREAGEGEVGAVSEWDGKRDLRGMRARGSGKRGRAERGVGGSRGRGGGRGLLCVHSSYCLCVYVCVCMCVCVWLVRECACVRQQEPGSSFTLMRRLCMNYIRARKGPAGLSRTSLFQGCVPEVEDGLWGMTECCSSAVGGGPGHEGGSGGARGTHGPGEGPPFETHH
jgi:hypothetical protein